MSFVPRRIKGNHLDIRDRDLNLVGQQDLRLRQTPRRWWVTSDIGKLPFHEFETHPRFRGVLEEKPNLLEEKISSIHLDPQQLQLFPIKQPEVLQQSLQR